jgi:hypothetical protein
MRRTRDKVDNDTGDLITTMVASGFIDGGNEMALREREASAKRGEAVLTRPLRHQAAVRPVSANGRLSLAKRTVVGPLAAFRW